MDKNKPLFPFECKNHGDMVSEYALGYLPAANPILEGEQSADSAWWK